MHGTTPRILKPKPELENVCRMDHSPFHFISDSAPGQVLDPVQLRSRACLTRSRSHEAEAHHFVPPPALALAMDTALCVGDPLLVTGDPGTGKTQSAYYLAWKLGLGSVLHFQVRSTSSARDLLYSFDAVQYFRAANFRTTLETAPGPLDKKAFRKKGVLWQAIDSATESLNPRVVLIDEIDKAPRDFPNDLLHELDQMSFDVPDTDEAVRSEPRHRPLVVITSNSERRLPEPFLRRCIFHHIEFNQQLLREILEARKDEFKRLSPGLIDLAVDRFLQLRSQPLRKVPSTAEFLVWLRVLATATNLDEHAIRALELGKLPFLGAMIKDHGDFNDLKR